LSWRCHPKLQQNCTQVSSRWQRDQMLPLPMQAPLCLMPPMPLLGFTRSLRVHMLWCMVDSKNDCKMTSMWW
jgi:hypothetical protein